MMDENNEQFVAYFLPTPETLAKRKNDELQAVNYREGEEWVIIVILNVNYTPRLALIIVTISEHKSYYQIYL